MEIFLRGNLRLPHSCSDLNLRNLSPRVLLSYFGLILPMQLSRTFKPERRRRQRQLLNTSVRVFSSSEPLEAMGINISDVGMCLFTMANLPIGSQIQVEFVPAHGTNPTRISATVCHRALYLYGIEFHIDSGKNPASRADGIAAGSSRLSNP
jgi:PilZ domain-containing protein